MEKKYGYWLAALSILAIGLVSPVIGLEGQPVLQFEGCDGGTEIPEMDVLITQNVVKVTEPGAAHTGFDMGGISLEDTTHPPVHSLELNNTMFFGHWYTPDRVFVGSHQWRRSGTVLFDESGDQEIPPKEIDVCVLPNGTAYERQSLPPLSRR